MRSLPLYKTLPTHAKLCAANNAGDHRETADVVDLIAVETEGDVTMEMGLVILGGMADAPLLPQRTGEGSYPALGEKQEDWNCLGIIKKSNWSLRSGGDIIVMSGLKVALVIICFPPPPLLSGLLTVFCFSGVVSYVQSLIKILKK